jgi:hypothetical protein
MIAPLIRLRSLQGMVLCQVHQVHEWNVAGPVLRCLQHSVLRVYTVKWLAHVGLCLQLEQWWRGQSRALVHTINIHTPQSPTRSHWSTLPCRVPLMKYYWSSDVLPILYEMYNADTLPEVKRLAHERRIRRYQVRSISDIARARSSHACCSDVTWLCGCCLAPLLLGLAGTIAAKAQLAGQLSC